MKKYLNSVSTGTALIIGAIIISLSVIGCFIFFTYQIKANIIYEQEQTNKRSFLACKSSMYQGTLSDGTMYEWEKSRLDNYCKF